MKEFNSWHSFRTFEQTVKRKNRYFHDSEVENFLQTVLATSINRKTDLPKNRYLWRAQLGHAWKKHYQDEEYFGEIPAPYLPERMKPLGHEAAEGRANPKGIPCLYLATTKETAMAEVRPWLDSLISVGQFRTCNDNVLIDCSVHHAKKTLYYLEEPMPEEREHCVWADIDKAFSKPTTNSDKIADYVPTQILSEFFRINGFDGIIYKSLLGEGLNVALFDLDKAELVNCFLYEVDKISFSFKDAAPADSYFVKKNK